MTAREFWDAVHADPELEWLGIREGAPAIGYDEEFRMQPQDTVVIRHARTGIWEFAASEVRRVAWWLVCAIVSGLRSPIVIKHITRIVGYYSFVRASAGVLWNRSKLAELADRRRGEYGVAA